MHAYTRHGKYGLFRRSLVWLYEGGGQTTILRHTTRISRPEVKKKRLIFQGAGQRCGPDFQSWMHGLA
jgi:hypothetical protein